MENDIFVESPLMTREEWYRSSDFVVLRFLNNHAAGLQHKAQEMRDILGLLASMRPGIEILDRFSVVERQLRVINLESSRLWAECRKLSDLLSPKEFTQTTNDSENTKTPPPQDQHLD